MNRTRMLAMVLLAAPAFFIPRPADAQMGFRMDSVFVDTHPVTTEHPYLRGLQRSDRLDIQRCQVADARTVLGSRDIEILTGALSGDTRATDRAASLSVDLRRAGLLRADQEVVGRSGRCVLTLPVAAVRRLER